MLPSETGLGKRRPPHEEFGKDGPGRRDRITALLRSHQTGFPVGCYCEDESRWGLSMLRALLIKKGAKVK